MVKKNKTISSISEDAVPEISGDNRKRPAEEEPENKDGKKRVKTKSLYRQPTVNELNRLHETESLFNSNLFRLQVEEILREVKLKEKTDKKIHEWFTEFKKHLQAIPEDTNEYDLAKQHLFKKLKVKLPVSKRLSDIRCPFKFHKFKNIEIVGSYALGSPINSKLSIDIQITVPSEVYAKNDSLNYRYHKKRATYLAYIASHLKKLDVIEEIKFSWLDSSETRPILNIKPKGKLGNHLTVNINLVCEAEEYKMHRFSPLRNNLREAWLLSDAEENQNEGTPTPYYNSSVLSDLTAAANHDFLKLILEKSENLKQAIVLLKIWLRQRHLSVSGHIVSMLVAYLVQIKRINNIMSSYQIVRNVWIFLKTSEWDTKGISIYKGVESPSVEEFHQHFPVVFLDVTGYYNLCWQMCKGTYLALRREAGLAVDMLDNSSINSFIPLFMVPVKSLLQFDYILRFKNLAKLKEAVLSKVSKQARLNYGLDQLALVTDTLHTLLAKGLGNRVDLILPLVEVQSSWPVNKSANKAKSEGYVEKLEFGFILNPENAFNIVEKGPPANLPEAEEFRAFWGDKSELRRFQDGSITETCVWEGDCLRERRTISKQIVEYLMQLKYDIPASELFHITDQFDSLSVRKQYLSEAEESAVTALQGFDDLRRDLRSLTELPLDVSSVYGVSPVFSYCDPLPPLPCKRTHNPWVRGSASLVKEISRPDGSVSVPDYTAVCKAVVELGHSGKWPANLEAFRCLKAAFNLQIADRLTKQFSLPTHVYPTHIDVLKNGLVFRLEIAHPKEIALLKREIENGVVKHRETDESVKLQCDTVLLPRLRGALHGLHQKHPAFGPTACLFKRWLSSHLLSPPHFPAILAELLSAAVFVHSRPLAPPNSPTCGLIRVLSLLGNTDWSSEVIVLDFNGDMKREEITELESKFNSREATTDTHIHIVTAYDGDFPSVWTKRHPTANVLKRAQMLAQATLKYIESNLLEGMKDNLLAAFVPSLSGYDVLIHLHPSLVPFVSERIDKRPEVRSVPDNVASDIVPIVEFNPVEKYLEELRSTFGEFALFFHDSFGGEVIAVLWLPEVEGEKQLQVGSANALVPTKVNGDKKYKVNKQALIEDFKAMGQGLVKDVLVT